MLVRFNIRNEKNTDYHQECEFDEPVITIGRDESNHLMLEDKRKAISRRHAEIQFDDGIYFIVDKGSRNGTFINNHRLTPDQPYALEHGSTLNIGDYVLSVSMQTREPEAAPPVQEREDATVFVSNPFLEEIHELSSLLDRIQEKYSFEDPSLRNEYLKQALQDMMQAQGSTEVTSIVGSSLGGKEPQVQEPVRKQHPPPPSKVTYEMPAERSAVSGEILDSFINNFLKTLQFMSQFHSEFIGTTRIETDDNLHRKSLDEVKEYLFNPELDYNQLEKRIASFRKKIEETNIHQVALLDGYRNSVREGVQELLREMNPAIVKNHIGKKQIELGPLKIPLSIIPFYVQLKTLEALQHKHYEFSAEDRGVVEKKHFRPAFSKRYLENMSNRKKDL